MTPPPNTSAECRREGIIENIGYARHYGLDGSAFLRALDMVSEDVVSERLFWHHETIKNRAMVALSALMFLVVALLTLRSHAQGDPPFVLGNFYFSATVGGLLLLGYIVHERGRTKILRAQFKELVAAENVLMIARQGRWVQNSRSRSRSPAHSDADEETPAKPV